MNNDIKEVIFKEEVVVSKIKELAGKINLTWYSYIFYKIRCKHH